jgi:hypothetical protein
MVPGPNSLAGMINTLVIKDCGWNPSEQPTRKSRHKDKRIEDDFIEEGCDTTE